MSDPEIDRAEEAEAAAMERHDAEHYGDPTQWYQDCEICAERIEKNFLLDLDKSIEADAFPLK